MKTQLSCVVQFEDREADELLAFALSVVRIARGGGGVDTLPVAPKELFVTLAVDHQKILEKLYNLERLATYFEVVT